LPRKFQANHSFEKTRHVHYKNNARRNMQKYALQVNKAVVQFFLKKRATMKKLLLLKKITMINLRQRKNLRVS